MMITDDFLIFSLWIQTLRTWMLMFGSINFHIFMDPFSYIFLYFLGS